MKIGITERGDAGLDLSWTEKLGTVDAAILITKHTASKQFQDTLLETYKKHPKIILHTTVTGWGNTPIEPNVPGYRESLEALDSLIKNGFPAKNCVLRVDPVWATRNGITRARKVLAVYRSMPYAGQVSRIRISVLDNYPHVRKRIAEKGWPVPYGGRFHAPDDAFRELSDTLMATGLIFECCAENKLTAPCFLHTGCVSEKDLEILGLPIPQGLYANPQNRNGCRCLSCKTELLAKREPCPSGCVYCFWKRPGE